MEDKLSKERLEELLSENYSLTEIGEMFNISTSWVSQLAKLWEVETPPPGHRKGQPHSEETRIRISKAMRGRENE